VTKIKNEDRLEIQYIPISDVHPWDKNPKKHNKKAIIESLKRFKPTQPILVQKGTHLIIAGHGRLEAFKELKYQEIPVIELDMPDKEAHAYALIDNQTVIAGGWDDKLLKLDLQDIKLELPDLDMSIFGFSEKQTGITAKEDDFDADAALKQIDEPITKLGDIITLGEHRLMCGDSTKKEDVERLMQGKKADIIVTSPPYAAQRTYEIGEFDWDALMNGMTSCFFNHLKQNGHALFNLGTSYKDRRVDFYWNKWLDFCDAAGWPLFGMYVWDKGWGMPGEHNGRLAPSHEYIFHFNKEKGTMNKWLETTTTDIGSIRNRFRAKDGSHKAATSPDKIGQAYKVPDSVIRISRAAGKTEGAGDHPAIFPVELPIFLMNTWSNIADVVVEPFGGSGTTIIAAEQIKRTCYCMEISPNYCDVIVKRWEQLTGKKAVRPSPAK
jgi:DNA modification methylase